MARAFLDQKQPAQQDQAGDDGRIGDVEHRPGSHVQEIGDVAQQKPVQQIPRGATQLQADAQPQQRAGAPLAVEYHQQNDDAYHGSDNQRGILILKYPERAARVVGVGKAEEPVPGERRSSDRQKLSHRKLGELVDQESEIAEPLDGDGEEE